MSKCQCTGEKRKRMTKVFTLSPHKNPHWGESLASVNRRDKTVWLLTVCTLKQAKIVLSGMRKHQKKHQLLKKYYTCRWRVFNLCYTWNHFNFSKPVSANVRALWSSWSSVKWPNTMTNSKLLFLLDDDNDLLAEKTVCPIGFTCPQ